jgi:hypothetical protein
MAHTEVSRLGKMFKTTFLPINSGKDAEERSVLTTLKFGAVEPTFGREPAVWMGFPLNVICAMDFAFQ